MASLPAAKAVSVYDITTGSQQRAYLHPLRMKILGFLAKEALTISQVAERLKVHPANITHHFKILLKTKLIQLVEERDIGRVVEKYYAAVAQVFNIRPPEGSHKNVNAKVLRFLRDDLSGSIELLKADDSESVLGLIMRARIGKKQFSAFGQRLKSLIADFEKASGDVGNMYALNVSLYPHQIDYGPIGRYELKKLRSLK